MDFYFVGRKIGRGEIGQKLGEMDFYTGENGPRVIHFKSRGVDIILVYVTKFNSY